ncbi:MAG: WYL domain-containing protein [Bacteroidia bacterium]|nr:WYL domain-containing protein [Bacteroidia bacterium]
MKNETINNPQELTPSEDLPLIIQVGSIITLKSHYCTHEDDFSLTMHDGKPEFVPPLMVVTEVLRQKKHKIDENTGDPLLTENYKNQYKCTWFSNTKFQFEETWFHDNQVKKIILDTNNKAEKTQTYVGQKFEFITNPLESKKQKRSTKKVNQDSNDYSITPNLLHVCPILIGIGTSKYESKDPIFDKFNVQIRYTTKLLIKCKYYNENLNKFSEHLIPIEALNFLNEPKIEKIKVAIKQKNYLKINFDGDELLVKPFHLIEKSGHYFLSYYDFYNSKKDEKKIPEIEPTIFDKISSKRLPFIETKSTGNIYSGIDEANITSLFASRSNNKYFIRYLSLKGDRTFRTISNPEVFKVPLNSIEIIYIKAFCYLREEERHFRLNRIESIEELI